MGYEPQIGMKTTTDIAIIGAGVIGSSIAYHLRKTGREVAVFDRGEIGGEASGAAAGLLAPLGPLSGPGPLADLLLKGFARFPGLVAELEEASGLSLEYEQTGALRVIREPRRIPHLQKRMQRWGPLGLHMQWLSGDEARQREPLLTPEVCAAVYAPEEAQANAVQVVTAFARAATNLGARFYPYTEITGINHRDNRITAITTAQGETISCDHLIIAGGAWTPLYGQWLNLALPITPLKGQILALRQPSTPLRHLIFGEAIYLAPKSDGTILAGATKEEVGFDKNLTAGGISWLLNSAIKLAPALQQSSVERMWAGLRPKSADGLPVIGPAPGWENIVLASGHGSVGILLSGLTGQMVMDIFVR